MFRLQSTGKIRVYTHCGRESAALPVTPTSTAMTNHRSTAGHRAAVRPDICCRIQPVSTTRRAFLGMILVTVLLLSAPRSLRAETFLHYKFQNYQEESDRIRVVSHYVMFEYDFDTLTSLRTRALVDTITGATPSGQPPASAGEPVPLATLEDERRAVVTELKRTFGGTTLAGEFAYSDEDDYLSRGYSVTLSREMNQKNTQLQAGFSYVDDDIQPAFFTTPRRKLSHDFLIGVTQLLDPNTTLTANLTYGTATGYLSDPYKIVRKSTEVLPGLTLPLTFPENRPARREKAALFLEARRFFDSWRASLEASYRYYEDDHGIESDTVEVAWFQHVGDRLVVRPAVRFYRQNAADYYFADLDAISIQPDDEPDSSTAFYSSDYRVSAFDATTVGLQFIYSVDDAWSIDLTIERYDMRGRDAVTSDSAYATANTITVGGKLWF